LLKRGTQRYGGGGERVSMEVTLRPYWSVAIYGAIIVATGLVFLGASRFLGPRRHWVEKEETYECGVPLLGSSRERFSVKFYLVAILFVLFDIETLFLLPWAVVFRRLGWFGLLEMLTFVAVLSIGFVYAWRRGGLDWD
jgi:NADH-quinone oxidoreductase subunit A